MSASNDTIQVLTGLVAKNLQEGAAFQEMLTMAQNGYQTDQARIDAEIQKAKDAVAQQIVDLTKQVTDLTAQVATLTPAPVVLADTPA